VQKELTRNETRRKATKVHFFMTFSSRTRSLQPVATWRQLPYLHKPAIIIMTSFARLAPMAARVLIMTSLSLWRHTGHAQRYRRTYGQLTAFNI